MIPGRASICGKLTSIHIAQFPQNSGNDLCAIPVHFHIHSSKTDTHIRISNIGKTRACASLANNAAGSSSSQLYIPERYIRDSRHESVGPCLSECIYSIRGLSLCSPPSSHPHPSPRVFRRRVCPFFVLVRVDDSASVYSNRVCL